MTLEFDEKRSSYSGKANSAGSDYFHCNQLFLPASLLFPRLPMKLFHMTSDCSIFCRKSVHIQQKIDSRELQIPGSPLIILDLYDAVN